MHSPQAYPRGADATSIAAVHRAAPFHITMGPLGITHAPPRESPSSANLSNERPRDIQCP